MTVLSKISRRKILFAVSIIIAGAIIWTCKKFVPYPQHTVGEVIDMYNGVEVYYNGEVDNVSGRNIQDNYNIGLKYQCVEFVKRYYYQVFKHKMPDSYGHAVSFFDKRLSDGQINTKRGLIQYGNPSRVKPAANDILVYEGTLINPYGHVSIVINVTDDEIEIIQQNPGPFKPTREKMKIERNNGLWEIKESRVLGRLRKK